MKSAGILLMVVFSHAISEVRLRPSPEFDRYSGSLRSVTLSAFVGVPLSLVKESVLCNNVRNRDQDHERAVYPELH